jgi:hypothetical protein
MNSTFEKKLTAALCVSALATSAFAQGTVQFANGPTTLISYSPTGTAQTLPPSPVGSYYYGLLISSVATGPFTFSGVLATNTAAGSKLGPAIYTPSIPGWAAGTEMFFEVAGWSASLGVTFKSGWLVNNTPAPPSSPVWGAPGFFGLSNIGSGTAGGGLTPPLPVFGGTGVSGFDLSPGALGPPPPFPEPSSLTLLGLGALLIFGRRR